MAAPAIGAAAVNAGRALVQAAPRVGTQAMDFVRRATGGRIGTIAAATQYATQSKNAFAVVAEGLVRAGLPPSQIFTDEILQNLHDADLKNLYSKLSQEFARLYGGLDAASPFKPESGATRDVIALETVGYVARAFGLNSPMALKKFHAHMKLFAAMDEAQLEQTLALRAAAAGGAGRTLF